MVSAVVSDLNARCPVGVAHKTVPKLKTSVRASTAPPRTGSGDIYPAVPTTTPISAAGPALIVAVRQLHSIYRLPAVVRNETDD